VNEGESKSFVFILYELMEKCYLVLITLILHMEKVTGAWGTLNNLELCDVLYYYQSVNIKDDETGGARNVCGRYDERIT
jgi:hypothetical protein